MSNQLIIAPNAIPALQLPASVLAKVQAQLSQAAANQLSSLPRLSFGGKQFNLTMGGTNVPLDDRILDVHFVAIDTQFHYAFYEKSYDESINSVDKGRILVRYPLPTDDFSFTPTHEFAQRAYKHRCVVMLANDPEHRLYVVDFGYNSVKKVGNPSMGLLNLSDLITQFQFYQSSNPQLFPFRFTVQMSFTRQVQPEIQFSFHDQRQQGNYQARFATPATIDVIVAALESGEVDNLMKVEYDSASVQSQQVQPQVVAPVAPVAPVVPTPPVAPVAPAQDGADELGEL